MLNLFASLVPWLVFFLLWDTLSRGKEDWRPAFLSAAVAWGVLLTLLTELLSLFRALAFWPLLGAWCFSLVMVFLAWRKSVLGKPLATNFALGSRFELFLLMGLLFLAGTVGLIALVAPPNTWDAMTYHLARVMHWMQNKSVAHYPTHILRQLYMPPWSEFAILHFQILSGADRLANGVQWFSMLGSAIGASCLAGRLGADRRGQIFSAVVSMTIPMGILQGSSTQNDYVTAFWLTGFVYSLFVMRERSDAGSALACGASLGLAMLTKATAYIYAFPFLLGASWLLLRAFGGRGFLLLSITAFVALTINLGHFLRNTDLFSNPLGLMQEDRVGHYTIQYRVSNEVLSLPVLLSNLVRNAAIHLSTPSAPINLFFERGVISLHNVLGVSPHDPRTTLPLGARFEITDTWFNEDSTGNLLHFVLLTASIFVLAWRRGQSREVRLYSLGLIAAFLVFSLFLKWQPFHSRLQLPWFVLGSPVIGVVLAGERRKWAANAILGLLLIGALPWVFFNKARPLAASQNIFNTPREVQYFRARHSPYSRAVQLLPDPQCKQIGLYLDLDSGEYPFWVLLYQRLGRDVRIEAVNVENISARKYADWPAFTPCAVLAINPLAVDDFQVNGRAYAVYQRTKFVTILTPR